MQNPIGTAAPMSTFVNRLRRAECQVAAITASASAGHPGATLNPAPISDILRETDAILPGLMLPSWRMPGILRTEYFRPLSASARDAEHGWCRRISGIPAGPSLSKACSRRSEPAVLDLARKYVAQLYTLGHVQILPQKTRLTCVARVRFAGLQTRQDGFLASFAVHRWLDSPRIVKTADYGPR